MERLGLDEDDVIVSTFENYFDESVSAPNRSAVG